MDRQENSFMNDMFVKKQHFYTIFGAIVIVAVLLFIVVFFLVIPSFYGVYKKFDRYIAGFGYYYRQKIIT